VSRIVPIARVDVFASRPFAGNPAAAVLDADGLTEAEMQAIAQEMKAPGTSFVSKSSRPDADYGLRKFTPTREVAYSGHTTLGAVQTLLDAGRLSAERVVFATTQGLLPVAIEPRGDGPVLWLEPPLPACTRFDGPLADILAALGLTESRLGRWALPAITADTDLLLPVPDLATLHGLYPDHARLREIGTGLGLRAYCLVSLETVEPTSAAHSRFFAPQYGIPEDIVTGSVHSSLAVWLHEAGPLSEAEGGIARFTAEQGDLLGRPGRLAVEVHAEDGRAHRVRVGGRAIVMLTGRLRVP
jgi:trans-2,3-dihydro-3-hydroxyanthranilate isomerase